MKRMPDRLAAPVRFIRRIASFRVPLYAANASFYLVLSVFPAILLVLALLPHTGLTEADLLSALHGVIPSVFEPALEWVVRDLGSNSSLTLISVSAIMAIWSSSRGVYCIKTGLNAIYGERESRGYVYTRLVSVLYTVLLLAALLLTLCCMSSAASLPRGSPESMCRSCACCRACFASGALCCLLC